MSKKEGTKKYVLMRFYAGRLATYKIIACNADSLESELIEFEKECIDSNLGDRIGILAFDEFEEIQHELADIEPVIQDGEKLPFAGPVGSLFGGK